MKTKSNTTVRHLFAAVVTLAFLAISARGQSADPYDKTYDWIDSNGQIHTSPLLETATVTEQMKALIAVVYADKTIPGQQYLLGDAGGTKDAIGYSIEKGHLISSNSQLYANYEQYSPFLQNLEFTQKGSFFHYYAADVTPDTHGMTVLLVEMSDDYQATQDTDEAQLWKHIKSITLLAADHRHYMDTGSKLTSGYLVNINRPLNKFFLAVKGDKMSGHADYAPFYEGYEQISPIDESGSTGHEYVENAYDTMVRGNKFPADHNCASVFAKGHSMMMFSKENTTNIQSNMLVYIPDGRLIGAGTNGNYNFYINNSANGDLRPYFFIPTLTLEAEYKDVDLSHVATVRNSWTSSIKSITNDSETERFRLLRSYDGVTWSEVAADDITAVITPGAVLDGTTGHITHNGATVEVEVREMQYPQSHTVYYRVYDRIEGTGFDETESNIAEVVIPGYEITNPTLNIELTHKSVFDKRKQINRYTNSVDFVLSPLDKDGIKNENISDGTGVLNLELRRFKDARLSVSEDNFAKDKGTLVANVRIERTSAQGTSCSYTVSVTDAASGAETYTAELVADGGEQLHVENHAAGGETWGSFTDVFDYDIKAADKADGSTYSYRLFALDAVNVVKEDGTQTNEIRSNVPMAAMPRMEHGTRFTDYSLDEISHDTEPSLAPSVPQAVFTPMSQADGLDLCFIEYVDNSNPVAIAAKTAQGIWTLNTPDGAETSMAAGAAGSLAIRVDDMTMGHETVMTIQNGTNTYGTPRRLMPYLPVVNVSNFRLRYNRTLMQYETYARLTVDLDKSAEDNFLSHGYGVWHRENLVKLLNKEEITDMRHHKHYGNVEDFSFGYETEPGNNFGVYTSDTFEGGIITNGEANAYIEDIRKTAQGTPSNPYALWYRVRYYAQYVNPEQSTDNDGNAAPRYVVVEHHAGAREEGNDHTTGIDGVQTTDNGVYPLYTSDTVNIAGAGAVCVFNMQGNMVATLPDNDADTRTLSLGHLPAGIYIVTLDGVPYKVTRH